MAQLDGCVDLQINGLAGVDFNDHHLTQREWSHALEKLSQDGTTEFLPTLITDSATSLCEKLTNLAQLCSSTLEDTSVGSKAVGIHLEGPFLSAESGYIGAHPKQHAIPLELDQLKRLVEAGNGWIRLVTLAPEQDLTCRGIEYLVDQKILVAAGHCNASMDQLRRAIDSGLSLFTHLGNACPPMIARHENIIHRVLALHDSLRVTLIADGHHLPLWLLDSWVDWFGEERVAVISDAISAALLPPGIHRLGDRKVNVGTDGVPRSEDGTHFVGSGTTLGRMRSLCQNKLGWSENRIQKLFHSNASRWLGL